MTTNARSNPNDQRDQRTQAILGLYTKHQLLTAKLIHDDLGIPLSSTWKHLRHMRDLYLIREVGDPRCDEPKQWELIQEPSARKWRKAATVIERRMVPARQIGMRRDPLVTALFGPACGAAA